MEIETGLSAQVRPKRSAAKVALLCAGALLFAGAIGKYGFTPSPAAAVPTQLNGKLADNCKDIAARVLNAPFAKNLGGAGSGGVVFKTTTGTVIKCGTTQNLREEGEALRRLQGLAGVVNMLRMVEAEGHILLELEFLTAITWMECMTPNGGCQTPAGETCDKDAPECFPTCKTDWGQGTPFMTAPMDKRMARDLIAGNVQAFHEVCKAAFSQTDASSGMNTMITPDGGIKLIDFEKGHDLGAWHAGLWCDHDQHTIQPRIEEITRCLKLGDEFRTGAMDIGAEIFAWKTPSAVRKLWKKADPAAIEASQRADIAQASSAVSTVLQKLAALPLGSSVETQ